MTQVTQVKQGTPVRWTWLRFGDLGVDRLYDLLALRCRVFVVEQGAFQDPDGIDRASWHLLGHDGDGVLQAYLRVVDPGTKHAEPSIGRVAVALERRGGGLGHALVAEGVTRCERIWPGRPIRLNAQSRLEAFYGRHGFVRCGEAYAEDGIPHLPMARAGRLATTLQRALPREPR